MPSTKNTSVQKPGQHLGCNVMAKPTAADQKPGYPLGCNIMKQPAQKPGYPLGCTVIDLTTKNAKPTTDNAL
ncbi:uncharacterized protein B0J16DRAFT_383042 [Fusarium flagelliforme]|uniref:uncharacterized protein n=1 Tax=Fusarium flagelliforme TaxID=2675880 RepID=UPI001E8EC62F|nr:uncharacterized protein B0J16DRAFT_383042 [Fusarium flagelliforme]KAH7189175.1 hypothetical protein B0J16DRAFT_383042 [Fusarium flagelliforme]